jgi:hypothetical protein
MPKIKKQIKEVDIWGIPTKNLQKTFGISPQFFKQKKRRGELLEGIHVFRLPNSQNLIWNADLLKDWLATGGLESPNHQRAIEQFLKSLPSNQI